MRRKTKYIAEYIGTIEITNGTIDATDPSYGICIDRVNNIKICNGTYECYAVYETKEPNHVARCRLVLDDKKTMKKVLRDMSWHEYLPEDMFWREYSPTVGVDSGIAGFFVNKPDFNEEEWDKFCDDFDDNSHKFIYENNAGDSFGFCTESGYGNGIYSVWIIRNNEGKITALEIRFL